MKFLEKKFITAILITLTKSIIIIYAEIPFMLFLIFE